MKKIKLTKGKFAIVDDSNFEWLNQWKWYFDTEGYAERRPTENGKKKNYFMHRLVLNTPKNSITDHINRNKLDNRLENLRIANKSINALNSKIRSTNTSGHIGIYRHYKDWRAVMFFDQKYNHLGVFKTKEEAIKAYHIKNNQILYKKVCCNPNLFKV